MIVIQEVSKRFDNILALNKVNLKIEDSKIFGIIGTNGAGKSTLLNILSGVYKQDSGIIKVDDEEVYENTITKKKIVYISDDVFFPINATPYLMQELYASLYQDFDREHFGKLIEHLDFNITRKVSTFSKGMKRQLSIMLAICTNVKYILLDETFDGLDPAMRQSVKSLFIKAMETKDITPIMASHNLREIEDICENVGLLHKGGVLLNSDIDNLNLGICKVQVAFKDETLSQQDIKALLEKIDIKVLQIEKIGKINTIIARDNKEDFINKINSLDPVFVNPLELTLEEIFIQETEEVGYDIKKIIF